MDGPRLFPAKTSRQFTAWIHEESGYRVKSTGSVDRSMTVDSWGMVFTLICDCTVFVLLHSTPLLCEHLSDVHKQVGIISVSRSRQKDGEGRDSSYLREKLAWFLFLATEHVPACSRDGRVSCNSGEDRGKNVLRQTEDERNRSLVVCGRTGFHCSSL